MPDAGCPEPFRARLNFRRRKDVPQNSLRPLFWSEPATRPCITRLETKSRGKIRSLKQKFQLLFLSETGERKLIWKGNLRARRAKQSHCLPAGSHPEGRVEHKKADKQTHHGQLPHRGRVNHEGTECKNYYSVSWFVLATCRSPVFLALELPLLLKPTYNTTVERNPATRWRLQVHTGQRLRS